MDHGRGRRSSQASLAYGYQYCETRIQGRCGFYPRGMTVVAAARLALLMLVAVVAGALVAPPAFAEDTARPTLISFGVSPRTVTPGSTVTIDYAAQDDSGQPLKALQFVFTDSVNATRYIDQYGDVPLSGRLVASVPDNWPNGSMQLSAIELTDATGKYSTYRRDGSVTGAPAGASGPTSHVLDLPAGDMTVQGSVADTSVPTLLSFSTSPRTVTSGGSITVDYVAEDNSGQPLRYMYIGFEDPLGRPRILGPFSSVPLAGSLTIPLPDDWTDGAHELQRITLSDAAANISTFYRDGDVDRSPTGATGPDGHSLSFAASDLVVEGSDADVSPPTLASFAVSPRAVTAGTSLTIDYVVRDDSAQPLEWVIFQYRDSLGGMQWLRQSYVPATGRITVTVPSDWPRGLLELELISVEDASGNRSDYTRAGALYQSPSSGPASHGLSLASGDLTMSHSAAATPSPSQTASPSPTESPTPSAAPSPTPTAEEGTLPPPRADGVTRLGGADRWSTAAAVAQSSFPGTADDVVLVTGSDWPDALSAGPAAARIGAPLLPVLRDSIPTAVQGEIDRLRPKRAVLVGGSGVLSDRVTAALRAQGLHVERVAGGTRYATAAAVAARFFPAASGAYYASGSTYVDALAGGAAAANRRWPLLLTHRDRIPADTPKLGSTRIVLGGPDAVSQNVVNELGARRIAGIDRYSTAAAIARDSFASSAVAYLATGADFPDGLAGAAAAARDQAPVLLVARDCAPLPTRDALNELGVTSRLILGGTAVISDRAANLGGC
jgi:putative cell wall-binding protein